MRRIQEMDLVPVGGEHARRPKQRGFLIALLRVILAARDLCARPFHRRRRGEEVEEPSLPVIEF